MYIYVCVFLCVYIYLFQALSVSIMSAALNVKLRIHCMFVVASRSKIQVAGEFLKSKIRAFFLKFLFYYTTLGECTPDPHLDSRHPLRKKLSWPHLHNFAKKVELLASNLCS